MQKERGEWGGPEKIREIAERSESGVINTHSHAVPRVPRFPWELTPTHAFGPSDAAVPTRSSGGLISLAPTIPCARGCR